MQAEAEAAVAALGCSLTANVTTAYSDTVASGFVISQGPVGGTSVPIGSSVNIVVSLGQPVVPDVVGLTQAEAEAVITAVDSLAANVSTAYSDTVAAGLVISQGPAGGTSVPIGSSVEVVVSLGQPVVPDVVGLTQAEAEAAITAVDSLTVSVSTAYSDTVAAGVVISQGPLGGTSVPIGSSVEVVVSLGRPVVPDVVGLTQAEAEAAITAVDSLTVSVSTAYSDTVEKGRVISQNPLGGTPVLIGSEVSIVVSLGKPLVAPDVVGMTEAAATTAIEAVESLTASVTTAYSNTVEAGLVITQAPSGGTPVPIGFTVSIVVSLGKPVVPDVVGMTEAAAKPAIEAVDSLTVNVDRIYSDTVAVGIVISQTPIGNTKVPIGSTVSIVVSLGPSVVVPDVVGMTEAAATTAIEAVDSLTASVSTAFSDTVLAGLVISQSPAGGTSVPIGFAVSIVLSLGKPVVPDVVGMTEAAARTAIEAVDNLTVDVTRVYSDAVEAGLVISQAPSGGTAVPIGSAVSIAVSLGPSVVVPDVVGMTEAAARAAIEATGNLTVTVSTAYSETVTAGYVISQNPSGGALAPVGSFVEIVVSLGRPPTVIHVDDDAAGDPVPNDPTVSDPLEDGSAEHPFDMIQEAIDVSVDGVTIIVHEGIYSENIDFTGENIVVSSTNPNDPRVVSNTVINGNRVGSVVTFINGNTADCLLTGLTITGGSAEFGGGIFCYNSSPTISKCVITGNWAELGGGMCNYNASPSLTNCVLSRNWATQNGGGMYNVDGGAAPVLFNCTFHGNFSGQLGGGLYNQIDSKPALTNCTFSGNWAGDGGSAMANDPASTVTLTNCILWDSGDEIWNSGTPAVTVAYSDIRGGWPGEGNIDVDPVFVNPAGGDYHLSPTSPCINAGDPAYTADPCQTDIDGELRMINGRVDMGVDEVNTVGPLIGMSARRFEFFADPGGPNPPTEALSIGNAGIMGTLSWTISHDCHWLQVWPDTGSSTGLLDEVTLSVDISGLAAGYYNCQLIVSEPNSPHSPQTVEVALYIGEVAIVPTQYSTIQDAIDNVAEHGVVVVLAGTYTGLGNRDIDFRGKTITVLGRAGPENTIIDCDHQGRGFYFHSGESSTAVLYGFTICNGLADRGGGILCENSYPTIGNCVVINNEPDGIRLEDSDSQIAGTVHVISNDITGNGTLQVGAGATLSTADAHISCNIVGLGTIHVPAGKELVVEGQAVIDLGDSNDPDSRGTIQCLGLLRVKDTAYLTHATVNVVRVVFEGSSNISENVISTVTDMPYGQLIVKESTLLIDNDIHANGDRYIDVDRPSFNGFIWDNRVFVTITEGQYGTDDGLFELRGWDLFCPTPPCASGLIQQETVPNLDLLTWTIERLELAEGAKLTLTNRFDFQAPYDSGGDTEVLYVKELVLGPNSVLDVGSYRLYYEWLDPNSTGDILSTPLFGLSLDEIEFDDEEEFANRVDENNFEHPENPAFDRVHIEQVSVETDPNGVMLMRNLEDLDSNSPTYGEVIYARAKTLFAMCSEDNVIVQFKYLFDTDDPDVQLHIYISDVPELLDLDDPDWDNHYVEVGYLSPPPSGRPGSVGSGYFGVFESTVSVASLDLTKGTWLELELIESQSSGTLMVLSNSRVLSEPPASAPATLMVDDVVVEVKYCGICMDFTGDNQPDEEDFLKVLAACGESSGLIEGGTDSRRCMDRLFSSDGYIDPYDIASIDWLLEDPDGRMNACDIPICEAATTTGTFASLEAADLGLPHFNLPDLLADLLIAGTPVLETTFMCRS